MIGTLISRPPKTPAAFGLTSRPAVASLAAATISSLLMPVAGQSRGAPDSFADLTAKLMPAVVNISTTQVVKGKKQKQPEFMVPPGSPFEEFFKEFLERNRPKNRGPRRATSLGSGFIIDANGLVVGSKILYRGVPVGEVREVDLSETGLEARVSVTVEPEHQPMQPLRLAHCDIYAI